METATTTAQTTPENLSADLDGFIGTEHYYRYLIGTKLTDGTKFLADKAKAYWLMDAIASYQMYPNVRNMGIQFWTLTVKPNRSAKLELWDDIPGTRIKIQTIPYTDFPLPKITLYCQDGVIFLPSEH